jgi:hypothetical protein
VEALQIRSLTITRMAPRKSISFKRKEQRLLGKISELRKREKAR